MLMTVVPQTMEKTASALTGSFSYQLSRYLLRTDVLGNSYISFKNKQQNQQTKMGTGMSNIQVLINSGFSAESKI